MDDKLVIGIPDDEAATAPKKRFRSLAASTGLMSKGLLPLAILGLASLGSRIFSPLYASPAGDREAPPRAGSDAAGDPGDAELAPPTRQRPTGAIRSRTPRPHPDRAGPIPRTTAAGS